MDEDEFGYEEGTPVFARKVNRADLFVIGFDFLRGIADSFSYAFQTAGTFAAGHSNFYTQQDAFHQEAALEIESLIAGEEQDG